MRRVAPGACALLFGLAGCYAAQVDFERSYNPSNADLSITRIVHGSVILDFRETRILVDPWYSPSPPLGPGQTIGLALDKLPEIRGIAITDDREVHLDPETLRTFAGSRVRVLVPAGLASEMIPLGLKNVEEVEPWQEAQIGSALVTAVPLVDGEPAAGFVFEANGVSVYVAGDTRYDPVMLTEIASAFPFLDVALLPIGGIRVFGRKADMTPEEAAEAVGILRPKRTIPYHYELVAPFPFVTMRAYPLRDFQNRLERRHPDLAQTIVVLEPGESWHHYK